MVKKQDYGKMASTLPGGFNQLELEPEPFTFKETLKVIEVFLKFLSQQLNENYDQLLTFAAYSDLSNMYYSLKIYKEGFKLDDTVESVISWLENTLNQYEEYLARLYQPGGNISQQAEQRFYNRIG